MRRIVAEEEAILPSDGSGAMDQVTHRVFNGGDEPRRRTSVVDTPTPEAAAAFAVRGPDTTWLDLIGAVVAVGFFLLPLLAGAFRG